MEINPEVFGKIRRQQQQNRIDDDRERAQGQNNHRAGDEGQHRTNEQVNDAIDHGDDADFIAVPAERDAWYQRKCGENR